MRQVQQGSAVTHRPAHHMHRRQTIPALRPRRPHRNPSARKEALPGELPDQADTRLAPHEALDQAQRVSAIEGAITALPERQSAALTLCALQGHSQAEAAEILEISVEALESLLARARRTLRAQLLEGRTSA